MRWVDRLDGWVAGCWIRLESSTQPHDAVPGWPERSCVPRGWIQSADPASSIQDPAKLPGFGIGRNAPLKLECVSAGHVPMLVVCIKCLLARLPDGFTSERCALLLRVLPLL